MEDNRKTHISVIYLCRLNSGHNGYGLFTARLHIRIICFYFLFIIVLLCPQTVQYTPPSS